jgi:hypothetical protein
MKKIIAGAATLMVATFAWTGVVSAELMDTGTKQAVGGSCKDLGGEWEANGYGNGGDPTCVLEEDGVLKQDNRGVTIEIEGQVVTFTHEDTETSGSLVTGGAWDDGVTEGGGGMCITIKNTGKTVCTGKK